MKVLKSQSQLSVYAPMVLIFLNLYCWENTLFLFASMKHLLILEILQETASEFPTLAATQREMETSIQPLKKQTANHLPVILKSYRYLNPLQIFFEFFTIISGFYYSSRDTIPLSFPALKVCFVCCQKCRRSGAKFRPNSRRSERGLRLVSTGTYSSSENAAPCSGFSSVSMRSASFFWWLSVCAA